MPTQSLSPEQGDANPKQALVSVIVKLDFEPLASYSGGIAGLPPTSSDATGNGRLDVNSPASQAYLDYANQRIDAFAQTLQAAIPAARIVHRYTVTLGGVSVALPPDQIPVLKQLPGVVSVRRDEVVSPDSEPRPDDGGRGAEGLD